MADGQPRSYTADAQNAASAAPNCSAGGCDACVKTGLPVLLVRPGLVDKATAGKASPAVSPLLAGVADPALTYAGYAMRTLRKGYLYAYYSKPHTAEIKAQKGWQAFRIDDGGYLTPTTLAALAVGEPPEFACVRTSSYATAMLFVIPDAKKTENVWVGFSASPWSEQTLAEYAADEGLRNQRMARIDAAAGRSKRSIALTERNIETAIVDYTPALGAEALKGNPFPRRSLLPALRGDAVAGAATQAPPALGASKLFSDPPMKGRPESASKIEEQANKLIDQASNNGYSAANLLIVSVPDPEGVTIEAAVRRVTLCNTAAEWVAHFPNGDWMMKSALQACGMLTLIEQQGADKQSQYAKANYSQYDGERMHIAEFERLKRDAKLPPDAEFIPHTSHDGMARTPDYSVPGYVSVPGADDIGRATRSLQDEVRGQLTRKVEGLDYRGFLNRYQQKAKADADRLKQVERDYFAWLQSDALQQLTCHDFNVRSQRDGWYYAQCIRAITYAGPLTEEGFKAFQPLVASDPANTDALITRALLGNRPQFFSWFAELEQGSKAYETAKGIFDLEPVGDALDGFWRAGAQQAAADLQTVASATMAGLDKLGQLSEKLRYQYTLLAEMLMTTSESSPIQLFRLRVTLPEATRIWNTMLADVGDVVRQAGQVGERKVQSLVMGIASAVEMNVGSAAALGVVDVYLLASGNDATWQKFLRPVKAGGHRYLVQPVQAGARAVAQYIDDVGLRAMTTSSVDVLRTRSGALSAGAGLLQVMLLGKAWQQYRGGSDEERKGASVAMLTAGLGVTSALLELGAMAAKQAGRELAETALKRVAGFIAAGATAIDAVQAFINVRAASTSGDATAARAFVVQGLLFLTASAAIFGATIAAGGTGSVLGMTALALTGWGLLLVGLGVLVGFLIMVLKDKPVEAWAAKTLWGDAGEKWGSYEREMQEANKVLAGVSTDFSYRWSALQQATAAVTWSNPVTAMANLTAKVVGLPTATDVALRTREIWFRLQMPKALRDKLPWRIRLYAIGPQGNITLASATGNGLGGGGYSAEFPAGVSNFAYTESEDGNQVVISADLDTAHYRSAHARVEIFLSAAAGDLYHSAVGAGGTTVKVLDQELRD